MSTRRGKHGGPWPPRRGWPSIPAATPAQIARGREANADRQAAAAFLARAELARTDFAAFFGFVMRDDDGHAVDVSPHIQRWIAAVTVEPRLIVEAPVSHAKTHVFSIAYPMWRLGRNPSTRIILLSATAKQAKKVLASIKAYMERSVELAAVFPHLRLDLTTATLWHSEAVTIPRSSYSKDPSIESVGTFGPLQGARASLVVADDVLRQENTETEALRDKVVRWLRSTPFGRVEAGVAGDVERGGQIILCNNPWHIRDASERIATEQKWPRLRDPCLDAEDRPVVLWPGFRDEAWIKAKAEDLGPYVARRQLGLQRRSDDDHPFRDAWLNRALERGWGRTLVDALAPTDRGAGTYTGVDLGIKNRRRSGKLGDETVLWTIKVHDDGTRELVHVAAGRWSATQILVRLAQEHHQFGSQIAVEDNAAQEYLVQMLSDDADVSSIIGKGTQVPVFGLPTGSNKHDERFGVIAIGTSMNAGKWMLPCPRGAKVGSPDLPPQVQKFVVECLDYTASGHTGDRLIAAWKADTAARMCGGSIASEQVDAHPPAKRAAARPPRKPTHEGVAAERMNRAVQAVTLDDDVPAEGGVEVAQVPPGAAGPGLGRLWSPRRR